MRWSGEILDEDDGSGVKENRREITLLWVARKDRLAASWRLLARPLLVKHNASDTRTIETPYRLYQSDFRYINNLR